MGAFEAQAARVLLPTETKTDAIPSGAATTAPFDIFAELGVPTSSKGGFWVNLRSTVACNIKGGPTTATTAGSTDWPISADTTEPWYVDKDRRYLSTYAAAAGTLYVCKSS